MTCTCTIGQAVLGDGCEHCNHDMAAEVLRERVAELELELEAVKAELERLYRPANLQGQ